MIAFGEIGLTGEIRPVPNGEERIKEAVKHGMKKILVPKMNMPKKGSALYDKADIIGVLDLEELFKLELFN